jgi:hypothetical protein
MRRELGGLAAVLKGLDAMVFCGGIGEHAWQVRDRVLEGMEWIGIEMDRAANRASAQIISSARSRVRVFVIPTNDEVMIARQTLKVLDARWLSKRVMSERSQTHFRNVVRDEGFGLGRRSHLGGGYSRTGLKQCCASIAKCDDRHFGHDQIHCARRCQGESAGLDNLRDALRGVLHRHDGAFRARHQIHGSAHAGHHLFRDHPIGQPSCPIDLQAA